MSGLRTRIQVRRSGALLWVLPAAVVALTLSAAGIGAAVANRAEVLPRCMGAEATIVGEGGGRHHRLTRIEGTAGADVIVGHSGRDEIDGRGGPDLICAGAGRDRVRGGRGADHLAGGGGSDLLGGNFDDDRLTGGGGRDELDGGAGEDRCRGGGGKDEISRCEVEAGPGSPPHQNPGGATASPAPLANEQGRPNIIVITTDDQHAASMNAAVMPNVMRLIADPGASFERSVVPTPLCCPSRASFLTGQYGHNNGVLWNLPGYRALRDRQSLLPVWLRSAGYRTIHIGKFLRGYWLDGDPTRAPAGWDQWATMISWRYYDYVMGIDGLPVGFGRQTPEYLTTVLNNLAEEKIRRYAPGDRPLFMVVDQFAPHEWPGTGQVERCAAPAPEPAWRDRDAFAAEPLPSPPSLAEADVSDKPSFIQARPQPGPAQISEQERRYRCGLAALSEVDRGVARIWQALEAVGEADETVLVFTSDNGFYYGEHRLTEGVDKSLPYREGIEVPLAIRLPDAIRPPGGVDVDELVANVDLAPTLLELAGASPCIAPGNCRTLDGRSLLRLALGQGAGWPSDRAIPIEADVGAPSTAPNLSCRYQGLLTSRHIYVHHSSVADGGGSCGAADESEHYDLQTDPFQLENLFPAAPGSADAAIQSSLAARAEQLAQCSGIAGRDPAPIGRSYCE